MSNRKRVLIVEDDNDVAAAMTIRMGSEFEVVAAGDGVSAMQAARNQKPDVIVLDLGLPAGDGLRVLGWLRDNVEMASTPVVVVTGRDGAEVEAKALALGAAAFFNKPADMKELLDTVRALTVRAKPVRQRVLVIEDDADTRAGLVERLRGHDFEVVTAQDGATALMAVKNHRPDLIVLDLGLPAGDGFAVLDRVRHLEHHDRTPVVVLSGRSATECRERALAAGASAFLVKPAMGAELIDSIEGLL